MKVNYNVTGPKRKALVEAISQVLNVSSKYLGAPTFAYEVGGYKIDRNGVLEGEDNSELVAGIIGLHGFEAVSIEYDTPLPEAEPIPEDIQISSEVTPGGRSSHYRDYEELPFYASIEQGEFVPLTIEIPKTDFTYTAIENL